MSSHIWKYIVPWGLTFNQATLCVYTLSALISCALQVWSRHTPTVQLSEIKPPSNGSLISLQPRLVSERNSVMILVIGCTALALESLRLKFSHNCGNTRTHTGHVHSSQPCHIDLHTILLLWLIGRSDTFLTRCIPCSGPGCFQMCSVFSRESTNDEINR